MLGEQLAAGRRVAGAGAQIVVDPPHFGQPLLGRAAVDRAPVFLDQRVEPIVMVQRDDAQLVDGERFGCDVASVDALEQLAGPAFAA